MRVPSTLVMNGTVKFHLIVKEVIDISYLSDSQGLTIDHFLKFLLTG